MGFKWLLCGVSKKKKKKIKKKEKPESSTERKLNDQVAELPGTSTSSINVQPSNVASGQRPSHSNQSRPNEATADLHDGKETLGGSPRTLNDESSRFCKSEANANNEDNRSAETSNNEKPKQQDQNNQSKQSERQSIIIVDNRKFITKNVDRRKIFDLTNAQIQNANFGDKYASDNFQQTDGADGSPLTQSDVVTETNLEDDENFNQCESDSILWNANKEQNLQCTRKDRDSIFDSSSLKFIDESTSHETDEEIEKPVVSKEKNDATIRRERKKAKQRRNTVPTECHPLQLTNSDQDGSDCSSFDDPKRFREKRIRSAVEATTSKDCAKKKKQIKTKVDKNTESIEMDTLKDDPTFTSNTPQKDTDTV